MATIDVRSKPSRSPGQKWQDFEIAKALSKNMRLEMDICNLALPDGDKNCVCILTTTDPDHLLEMAQSMGLQGGRVLGRESNHPHKLVMVYWVGIVDSTMAFRKWLVWPLSFVAYLFLINFHFVFIAIEGLRRRRQ